MLPFFPLYYGGRTKFSPIHASDIASLINYVITKEIYGKDIEAIGPQVLTFKEIIEKLIKSIDKKRILIPLPLFIAKISATFFQMLPNPLLTKDQLNLLKYDNVKSENGITNFDLGCPSEIYFDQAIKKYAYNWRDGGKFAVKEIDQL